MYCNNVDGGLMMIRSYSFGQKICLGIVLALFATGCSTFEKVKDGRKIDYKKSKVEDRLEVPPDLTSTTIDDSMVVPDIDTGGTATFSDYNRERSGTSAVARTENVLPGMKNIQVRRDGDKRWLVLKGEPSEHWESVRDFWLQSGFLIKFEDPRLGILETDWAENRADIPTDFIRSAISKAFDGLYSAATRDKYRVRLEKGVEPGTTEVYVTHRGAKEVGTEDSSSGGVTTVWAPREADPELEAEFLTRMMMHFGIEEQRARRMLADKSDRPARAQLVRKEGVALLSLQEQFDRAWRRTGIALDRVGFTVEDRDRSRGLYYVRYVDFDKDVNNEKSWFSKLAFWSSDEKEALKRTHQYLVNLVEQNGQTSVTILDKDGKRDNTQTAQRILSLLHDQLK